MEGNGLQPDSSAETPDPAERTVPPGLAPLPPSGGRTRSMETDGPDMDAGLRPGLGLVADVPITLTANLGQTSMLVGEIMELRHGSVVELDRAPGDAIDLLANGELIARGEVIVIDERFGVRVTSLVNEGGAASSGHTPRQRRRKEGEP
jgi:flagellar motor switch protein FliN/FliY